MRNRGGTETPFSQFCFSTRRRYDDRGFQMGQDAKGLFDALPEWVSVCFLCERRIRPNEKSQRFTTFLSEFWQPNIHEEKAHIQLNPKRVIRWPNASYGFTFFIGPLWVSQLTKKKKKDFHSISIFVTAIVGSQHIFSAPFSGIFIKCSRCLLWFSVSAVFFLRCVPRLVTCWCCNWTRHIFLMD